MTTDNIDVNTQSSIKISSDAGTIYIDPLEIKDESHDADYILITHDHYDHFSPKDIEKIVKEDTILVVPEKMGSKIPDNTLSSVGTMVKMAPKTHKDINGLKVETVPAYNKLKPFHPKSSGWIGYILTIDDKRVYIAGDTDLTNDNESVVCDIALIPIGGTYTMNAVQAAQLVNVMKPQVVIPTHYGSLVGKPEDADVFKSRVDKGISVELKLQ